MYIEHLAFGKTQDHMLATLSRITPPRDGGCFAMSIGPCPPAAGHDGYGFHWMLRRPTDPAPYTGATGHDGSPGPLVGPPTRTLPEPAPHSVPTSHDGHRAAGRRVRTVP